MNSGTAHDFQDRGRRGRQCSRCEIWETPVSRRSQCPPEWRDIPDPPSKETP